MSSDTRNWLERLGDKIPGYSGYVDRERRRDIDKLHREHLADRLGSLKAPLTEVIRVSSPRLEGCSRSVLSIPRSRSWISSKTGFGLRATAIRDSST